VLVLGRRFPAFNQTALGGFVKPDNDDKGNQVFMCAHLPRQGVRPRRKGSQRDEKGARSIGAALSLHGVRKREAGEVGRLPRRVGWACASGYSLAKNYAIYAINITQSPLTATHNTMNDNPLTECVELMQQCAMQHTQVQEWINNSTTNAKARAVRLAMYDMKVEAVQEAIIALADELIAIMDGEEQRIDAVATEAVQELMKAS
jgi:hypothetical protein